MVAASMTTSRPAPVVPVTCTVVDVDCSRTSRVAEAEPRPMLPACTSTSLPLTPTVDPLAASKPPMGRAVARLSPAPEASVPAPAFSKPVLVTAPVARTTTSSPAVTVARLAPPLVA